jgi:hypothetical protein
VGRLRSLAPGAIAIAVVLGHAGEAEACRPIHDGRFVSTPFADAPGLELVDERVELECSAKKRVVKCRLVARYELVNAGAETWSGHVAIAWSSDAHLRASLVDATAVELPESIAARVDAVAAEQMRSAVQGRGGAAFETRLAPGATAVIDVVGSMVPGRFVSPCNAVQVERRHMIVSAPAVADHYVTVVRGDVPARSPAELELRVPDWWVRGRVERQGRRGYGRFGRALAPTDPSARLRFERRPPFFPGGPIVGVGVDVRERAELKLRGGWELGPTKWMFASVVVESDARSHVEVVPTVEVTFPNWSYWLLWFPAPSLGLGAPVQVWPSVRPGVRTHAGLHWHVVGIIGFFDAYPRWRGEARKLLGGVALQFGI